jgi:hypothetical protein
MSGLVQVSLEIATNLKAKQIVEAFAVQWDPENLVSVDRRYDSGELIQNAENKQCGAQSNVVEPNAVEEDQR